MDEQDVAAALTGDSWMSVAEMFARAFPPGSPLPAYLHRLLLVNDLAVLLLRNQVAAAIGKSLRCTSRAPSCQGRSNRE